MANHFVKFCEENKIDYLQITYGQLQDYFIKIREKSSNANTFNMHMWGVRLFYRFLIESGRLDESMYLLLRKIKQQKVERKIKTYVTKEELSSILYMAETFCTYMDITKMRALLYFMFYTGLRKGELLNLRRSDIDLENRTVIVKTPTKNKNERIVPFPKIITAIGKHKSINFVQLLKDYFTIEGEVSNAFNMSDMKFTFLFNSLEEFSPEKKLTPHLMRHSFARMLAKHGIDSRVAQKLLGHKDIATTMIYYDPDIDTIQDLYNEKVK